MRVPPLQCTALAVAESREQAADGLPPPQRLVSHLAASALDCSPSSLSSFLTRILT